MKKLNQVKTFMLAALATMLLACEPPIDDPVIQTPGVQPGKLDVKATLYAYSLNGAYNNPAGSWAQFQVSGETDVEGMEQVTISHYRSADFDEDGIIIYKKDDFFIYVDEANTMYGTYDGIGQIENGRFSARWELTIEEGTGRFADVVGKIIEVVRLREGPDVSPVYEVDLSGTILIRQNYY